MECEGYFGNDDEILEGAGKRQFWEVRSLVGGGEVMESEEAEEERATVFSSGQWELRAEAAETLEGRGKVGKAVQAEVTGEVWGRSTDDEEGRPRMDILRGVLMCKEFVT